MADINSRQKISAFVQAAQKDTRIAQSEDELSRTKKIAEDLAARLRQLEDSVAQKNRQIAESHAQIAEDLYHLNRINASPWWRFGMWFTRLIRAPHALLVSLRSKPHSTIGKTEDAATVRRILVADHRIPRADISAGERATFGILRDLCALGFEVVFLPGDLEPAPVYEAELKRHGVAVITRAQGYQSMTDYLNQHGHKFGAFYLIRFTIAEQALDVIRQVAPAARVIFHSLDLHFLREMREAELQNDDALRAAASEPGSMSSP